MTQIVRLLPLIALLFTAACSTPGDEVRTSGSAGSTDDAQAIRQTIDELWAALGEHDQDAFAARCGDDWHLYTAGGKRFDVDRLFEVHRANIRDFTLEAENLAIHVRGRTAWVTYDATMAAQAGGEPWGGRFLMTNLFERHGDRWLCVHMHESRISD